MRSLLLTCLILVVCLTGNAQNIVKNGGHEDYLKMPSVVNLSDSCFRELYAVGVTPPIFNPINPPGIASANASPDHLCNAPRTGKAHGGLFVSSKSENPEYELCFPLESGFRYRVSTYILLRNTSDLAVDLFGFWFTNWGYASPTAKINEVPDYRTPENEFLTDVNNYQKIGFTYTADGGETALVLGDFVDSAHPQGSNTVNVGGGIGSFAYYYIDDINVSPIPELEVSYTVCPGAPANIVPKNYSGCNGKLPVAWFNTSDAQQIISTNDTLDVVFTENTSIGAIIGEDTVYTQVLVSNDQYPNPLPDTSYICEGSTKLLNADVGIAGVQYLWSTGENTASITVNSVGTYSVTVTIASCSYTFETIVLNALNPDWHLEEDTFYVCGTDPIIVEFDLEPGYKIISSDGQMGTKLSFTQTGVYQLRLSPSCNPTDFDTISILPPISLEKSIRIPNAFTPNSDSKNDLFKVVFDKIPTDYELNIFNRWGKIVFTSFIPTEGWDGKFLDVPAASDVYVYSLKCTVSNCGATQEVKRAGDLTLVR